MITPSFSPTSTERVLPKLALDFTTAILDPRITFTRSGSTATLINSNGYIEAVAANTPRFDHDPVTLACKGLLIEESKTNAILNSSDFTGFFSIRGTVSASAGTSPDNTNSATSVSTTDPQGILIIETVGTAINTTLSLFVKYVSGAATVKIGDSAGHTTDFDLSTGTITGNFGGNGGSIQSFGNGWYRCITTFTVAPDGGFIVYTYSASSILIWGAQLETGTFVTSYIPTTGAAATRNADVATMTGTNFSDWYSAGDGGVVTSVLPSTVSGTRPVLQFDDATANEVITLRGSTTNPELVIVDGGSPQAQIDAGTIAANTTYNLGAAWNTDNCAAAVNGGSTVTDTSATIPTVTQARLGADGTNYLNGHLQTVRYWPQRIINAEVQAFSK